jgi:hypothetical protein
VVVVVIDIVDDGDGVGGDVIILILITMPCSTRQ